MALAFIQTLSVIDVRRACLSNSRSHGSVTRFYNASFFLRPIVTFVSDGNKRLRVLNGAKISDFTGRAEGP
jgi:hypothetical protein